MHIIDGAIADVAQWQSTAFVKLRLRVRLPPSAVEIVSDLSFAE